MIQNFIENTILSFKYYKSLGDQVLESLEEEDLFWQYNETSNSVAIIVHHLAGNMKSRWTDFFTTDGEKESRDRDREFEPKMSSKNELLILWEAGWETLFNTLQTIDKENFHQKIYIRNQEHTVMQAVHRQMMHYAGHVGQIIYIGKMIRGQEWKNLSIPKGESKRYNATKFSIGKHDGFFATEIKDLQTAADSTLNPF